MQNPKRIGVWQTAFLGDAVLILPLLRALSLRFPEAETHLFVRKGFEGLFAAQPGPASCTGFDKRGAQRSLAAAWRFGRAQAARGFDVWISAHQSARSAVVARAVGARLRIGYSGQWFAPLAYTHRVDRRFHELHEVERLMRLGGPLGIPVDAPSASLTLPDDAHERARAVLAERAPGDGPLLGIHPGSTWPTKCWSEAGFVDVARQARQAGARVAVFGGPGEEPLAGRIAAASGAADCSGRFELPALAAAIGMLDAYLTNDSGPMHLAWVQDVPVVALFGPTVRGLGFAPRGPHSTVVETALACRPCGLHGHKRCPEGHHRCMADITPARVWAEVAAKLGLG